MHNASIFRRCLGNENVSIWTECLDIRFPLQLYAGCGIKRVIHIYTYLCTFININKRLQVYQEGDILYNEVKVEPSEIAMYEQDEEQPEVLYEEVYEIQEV